MHEASRERQPRGPAVSCCFGQPHRPPRGPPCSCRPPGRESGPAAPQQCPQRDCNTWEIGAPCRGTAASAVCVRPEEASSCGCWAFCPQEAAVCPCSQWACMQCVPAPRAARPRSSPTSQMRGRRRGRPKALARGRTSGTALGSLARSYAPSCPACLSPTGSPSLSRGQMRLACV